MPDSVDRKYEKVKGKTIYFKQGGPPMKDPWPK